MNLIEDSNFINPILGEKIDNLFLKEKVIFELSSSTVNPGDGGYHFVHHIKGDEDKWTYLKDIAMEILNSFCNKNNIIISRIFRCAINITFNNGKVYKCPVHTDHEFNHKQLLIYLNDNHYGDTVILKDNKPLHIVNPKKFKGILFDSLPHYHYFPIAGIRIVIVYTFLIKNEV